MFVVVLIGSRLRVDFLIACFVGSGIADFVLGAGCFGVSFVFV